MKLNFIRFDNKVINITKENKIIKIFSLESPSYLPNVWMYIFFEYKLSGFVKNVITGINDAIEKLSVSPQIIDKIMFVITESLILLGKFLNTKVNRSKILLFIVTFPI